MSGRDRPRAWDSTLPIPSKRMERKTPLSTRKPINPRNAKRRKQLFERGFGSAEYVAHVKGLPCVVPGCTHRDIEAAHVVSRGAGGGPEDIVPLCRTHHREQHDSGIRTFEDRYELDLDIEAGLVWQGYHG